MTQFKKRGFIIKETSFPLLRQLGSAYGKKLWYLNVSKWDVGEFTIKGFLSKELNLKLSRNFPKKARIFYIVHRALPPSPFNFKKVLGKGIYFRFNIFFFSRFKFSRRKQFYRSVNTNSFIPFYLVFRFYSHFKSGQIKRQKIYFYEHDDFRCFSFFLCVWCVL